MRVPEREKFLAKFVEGSREDREERLFDHLKLLYSAAYLKQLKSELEVMTEKGMDDLYKKTMSGYLDRLCSLKHFMKELKERFSRWFNCERALEELRGGKKLSWGELLRCRVRYFSDGLVLGSQAFVEEASESRREWFGEKRKRGARGLPLASGGLRCLGDLKKETLS